MSVPVAVAEWTVFVYFCGLTAAYLFLDVVSLFGIKRWMQSGAAETTPQLAAGLEPPVSILVPAYNEEATIEATIRALLQLDYPEFEICVINDGSRDGTLDVLTRAFSLAPFPEAYRVRIPTKPVRAIYHSTSHPNLRVIHKDNGGKADSLNAGINGARYPLVCSIDADSVLQRDSLRRVARPFLEDVRTVASGGTVRIANGCEVEGGFVERIGVPRSPLALLQVVEYLRAFLFGRLGWSPLNALLIISGTFGLFHKETVVAAGGYRTDTVGEDMELVVRLHRMLRASGKQYRISFVPDPICWTEAPEDLRTLGRQRIRWHRGLMESLWANKRLFLGRRTGVVGWLAFPFVLLFEGFGPIIEMAGYLTFVLGAAMGFVSVPALLAFLSIAVGLGILLSVSAILLEELSFHVYPKPQHVLLLFGAAIAENLGYRQINSLWRFLGFARWIGRRKPGEWGAMRRTASWRKETPPVAASTKA